MPGTNSYLTQLNDVLSLSKEDKEPIDKSINYLKAKLWETFQDRLMSVEVFGSYDRETGLPQRVDNDADVDILVIFKTNQFQPDTFLKHLKDFADKIYSRSDVSPDHPAITVELEHIRFDLVPAYWKEVLFGSDELQIPAPRSKEIKWISTDPAKTKKDLSEKNDSENKMITPLIRIIKYFNALNGKPYSSFQIEEFAIHRGYPKKELKDYFFEFINDLNEREESEDQVKFIRELKERRANLLLLEQRNLNDYIELELQKIIPIP